MKCSRIISAFLILVLCFSTCWIPSKQVSARRRAPKLNVTKLKLVKTDDYKIRVYNLSKKEKAYFSTSNSDVVAITKVAKNTKKAYISANGVGSATIKVKIKNRRKVTIKRLKVRVNVTPTAISLKFAETPDTLNVGDVYKLVTIVKPSISDEVPLYGSSDSDIATINSKGVITCLNEGEVTIMATLLHAKKIIRFNLEVRSQED